MPNNRFEVHLLGQCQTNILSLNYILYWPCQTNQAVHVGSTNCYFNILLSSGFGTSVHKGQDLPQVLRPWASRQPVQWTFSLPLSLHAPKTATSLVPFLVAISCTNCHGTSLLIRCPSLMDCPTSSKNMWRENLLHSTQWYCHFFKAEYVTLTLMRQDTEQTHWKLLWQSQTIPVAKHHKRTTLLVPTYGVAPT